MQLTASPDQRQQPSRNVNVRKDIGQPVQCTLQGERLLRPPKAVKKSRGQGLCDLQPLQNHRQQLSQIVDVRKDTSQPVQCALQGERLLRPPKAEKRLGGQGLCNSQTLQKQRQQPSQNMDVHKDISQPAQCTLQKERLLGPPKAEKKSGGQGLYDSQPLQKQRLQPSQNLHMRNDTGQPVQSKLQGERLPRPPTAEKKSGGRGLYNSQPLQNQRQQLSQNWGVRKNARFGLSACQQVPSAQGWDMPLKVLSNSIHELMKTYPEVAPRTATTASTATTATVTPMLTSEDVFEPNAKFRGHPAYADEPKYVPLPCFVPCSSLCSNHPLVWHL